MLSSRALFLLAAVALPAAALAPACHPGLASASDACVALCDKELECLFFGTDGAEGCRDQCAAMAEYDDAVLASCVNREEILAAKDACFALTCESFQTCLWSAPVCSYTPTTTTTTSSTTTSSTTSAATAACEKTDGATRVCVQFSSAHACEAGTTSVSVCSADGLLGTCVFGADTAGAFTVYYYVGGGYTLDAAQKACGGGVWTTY